MSAPFGVPPSIRRNNGLGGSSKPRPKPNIKLSVPSIIPKDDGAQDSKYTDNSEISVEDAFNQHYARNAETLLALPSGEMVSPPVAAVGDLRREDVQSVRKLGEGAGGTVMLCRHGPSGTIMAKKSVPADPNPTVQRQIIRELRALRRCNSPYIVSFYGAFIEDEDIAICMEYCEGGSLDAIYKRIKTLDARIGEGVLGKVAEAVLNGLVYLHQLEIIHRDVKPSNILINGLGLIKLCDFGVSGELVDSVARTFLGTSYYMAPERIQGGGKGYKVSSDVWSLGLTIMEVAEGRFPFPPQGHRPLAMFELLDYVVTMPVPELGPDWSDELRDFVRCCLRKDPNQRPTPKQMLTHRFVVQSSQQEVDLKTWINEVWA